MLYIDKNGKEVKIVQMVIQDENRDYEVAQKIEYAKGFYRSKAQPQKSIEEIKREM